MPEPHRSVISKSLPAAPQTPAVAPTPGHQAAPDVSLRSITYQPDPQERLLSDRLLFEPSLADINAVDVIRLSRPPALRRYDQIAMKAGDLLSQVALAAPYLEGKAVAFVGDHDGASPLLGLLRAHGHPAPRRMTLLDFDKRILKWGRDLARHHGFDDLLSVQAYNVFDPVPSALFGQFDFFYTNPPYGSNNNGQSAQLFITRCLELCRPTGSAGLLILPYDTDRQWTTTSMLSTQQFIVSRGWCIRSLLDSFHEYHLDDDADLRSGTMLVDHVSAAISPSSDRFEGRRIDFDEVPSFYGSKVYPPYPRYIREDGTEDCDWS